MRAGGGKLLVGLALLVALFTGLGCGDDDQTTADQRTTTAAKTATEGTTTAAEKPSVTTIEVVGGQPQGGVRELEVDKGETVEFRVRSDVADHVHVHGYDLFEDITAGGSASFSFPAEIDGIFEIELEDTATQIAELRVNP